MSDNIKDVYAQGYSRTSSMSEPRLDEVLRLAEKMIPPNPASRVLDIGCGDGAFALKLGTLAGTKQVFGLDISHEAAQTARQFGVTAQALDTDQSDLPYESGYFDLIYCGSLVELVFNPDHLLEEIHRVLLHRDP